MVTNISKTLSGKNMTSSTSNSNKKSFIDRAVIEINGGCNYTCKMCPQTTSDGKHGARGKNWLKKMSLDRFERIVSECKEHGVGVINLEGSGEPTLNSNLDEYVKIVKKYNIKAFAFSNGYRMKGDFMKRVVDAGIDFYRFSIIGYDPTTYKQWMNSDNFHTVVQNLNEMQEYVCRNNFSSDCMVATYHLIMNNDNIEHEKKRYLEIVNHAGVKTEIWKMHNWSGVYQPEYGRKGKIKTCGRPFSPDIVIRAGGEKESSEKWGAVHPCCQVLGNDDAAILGHVSENSIEEIWNGNAYEKLREDHRTGNYPDYCKSCDFLIDDPEVLIYTNFDRDLYKMVGTSFDLNDFRE